MHVRASGGGVVPLGPGVLNLSLVWRAVRAAPCETDAIYRELCGELTRALARLGIDAAPRAVSGAFCDGRFNLAAGGRKLAGTAQSWRRIAGQAVVLAHAVIVVDADPRVLTDAANAFERDLGAGRHYRAEALTSVAQAWQQSHGRAAPADLQAQVARMLAEQFAHVLPPHEPALDRFDNKESAMVLLEFSMAPLGQGESVSAHVARILDVIDRSGVPYQLTPMGTILEGEWVEVMAVVTACFETLATDCSLSASTSRWTTAPGPRDACSRRWPKSSSAWGASSTREAA